MLKRLLAIPLFAILLCAFACPSTTIQSVGRDTSAALEGAIDAAQSQYLTTCKANPQQTPCTVINQAVAGQNALVTALEAYCGWSITSPPATPATTPCAPVSSAQAGLNAAISNANLFITELKGVIQ